MTIFLNKKDYVPLHLHKFRSIYSRNLFMRHIFLTSIFKLKILGSNINNAEKIVYIFDIVRFWIFYVYF